jgi:hypothetical protein
MLQCGHVNEREGGSQLTKKWTWKEKNRSLPDFARSPRFQVDPAGQTVFSKPSVSLSFARFKPSQAPGSTHQDGPGLENCVRGLLIIPPPLMQYP